MESYLTMTQISDFIFCPRSLYYSGIYRNTVSSEVYHQPPQITGQAAHQTIDEGTYSSRKSVLCGMTVYSEKYNLLGVIDVLDTEKKMLTERKYSVTAVYDGFRYQLYAQYFALREMGYDVRYLRLHSRKDNRNYDIALPSEADIGSFEEILRRMRQYRLTDDFMQNPKKCAHCIYQPLCDIGQSPEGFGNDVAS